MHFCTAFIAISSDQQQIAYRGPDNPISWPEIEVIRQLHGDHAVQEVKPFVQVDQSSTSEKERLSLIYGPVVGEKVYTGRRPNMDMDAAEMTYLEPGTEWRNPITREVALVPEAKLDGRSKAARAKIPKRDEKGRIMSTAVPDEPTLEL
jgi:hypothetical protein